MATIPAAAVLFDLGNTLVAYYTGAEFPSVLRRCLRACADALGLADGSWDPEAVFRDAMRMNAGRPDFAVRLLDDRLNELFGPHRAMDERVLEKVCDAFLHPIFELARVDAEAIPLLEALRQRGIKPQSSRTRRGEVQRAAGATRWLGMAFARRSMPPCSVSTSAGANPTPRHFVARSSFSQSRPPTPSLWAMTRDGTSSAPETPGFDRSSWTRVQRWLIPIANGFGG